MDVQSELIQTHRAEAVALFSANQAARLAAERVTGLVFVLVGITAAAGINTHNDDVAIALPPVVLLLLSYMLQQYADLTVLGAAREQLESRANALLGERALIYESVVAPIRKRSPLVASVRILQWLSGLVVLGVVVVGTAIAFDGHPALVEWGYTVLTTATLASVALSYSAMRRSGKEAARQIAAHLDLPAALPTSDS